MTKNDEKPRKSVIFFQKKLTFWPNRTKKSRKTTKKCNFFQINVEFSTNCGDLRPLFEQDSIYSAEIDIFDDLRPIFESDP